VAPLTAFILAGGKSSRMGSEKAFLELGGRSLLALALQLAGSVTPEVKIVGEKEKFSTFGPVVEDVYPGRGPLGGIHAALAASATDYNLVLAVDLPFLRPRLLGYLASQAQLSEAVVTVPRASGQFQPLCAIYRKQFVAHAEQALAHNRNKVDALFREAPLRIVDDDELERAGFHAAMFRNLNTREDWEQAKQNLKFEAAFMMDRKDQASGKRE